MTLRDNFADVAAHTLLSPVVKGDESHLTSDNWAFDYISLAYMQPIMEAFDDDGSGYVTVYEVNHFTDGMPQSLDWG